LDYCLSRLLKTSEKHDPSSCQLDEMEVFCWGQGSPFSSKTFGGGTDDDDDDDDDRAELIPYSQ
jgi:hypothetical protein